MMALQRKDIVTGGDMRTPVIFIKQNHQTISFQVKLWRKSFFNALQMYTNLHKRFGFD